VLNREVWLYDVMPQGSAIYDLVSPDSLLPTYQNQIYDIPVLLFDEGSRLFFQTVPELGNSQHPNMYDDQMFNVSLEACAEACTDTYKDW
jgi:hypothetical protein